MERIAVDIAVPFGGTGQKDESGQKTGKSNIGTGTTRTDELIRFVYGIILWQEHEKTQAKETEHADTFDTSEMSNVLREIIGENVWQSLRDLDEQDKNKIIFEAEMQCAELSPVALGALFDGYRDEIQERMLRRALQTAREKLREAEAVGDEEAKKTFEEECGMLAKRLGTIGRDFKA